MKRWHKIALAALVLIALLAGLAVANRTALMIAYVKISRSAEFAPTRELSWERGPASAVPTAGDRPPNIVFVLIDDLGINDLPSYGEGVAGGRVPTPNIDRLVSQGAKFTNAYSGSATCAVSRAMLMTGRYPTRTGFEYTPTPAGFGRGVSMIANDLRSDLPPAEYDPELADGVPAYEEQGLPSNEVTIAEILAERGYHNVQIGKWHLGTAPGFRPIDQGFHESLLMESGLHLPEDDPEVVNAKVDFDPIDKFLWASSQYVTSFNGGEKFTPGGYLADYWTDQSLEVIEANRNRPFFLYLAHWGVHTPLQATREDYKAVGDLRPHRLRVYAAMIRSIDRSVGRLLDKLDQLGLSENTIFVLSSDNGGPGYIGLPQINSPYRGFKITLFEGGIRVPLVMAWPNRITAGSQVDAPATHVDLFSTFVSAAGASPPAGIPIDGRDLLPLATGTGQLSRPDNAIFWESGYYKVVRAGNWKLQVNGKQKKVWLYDLAADPTERRNLARLRPDKVAELQRLLAKHQQGRKAPLYPSTTDMPVMIDKTLAQRFVPGDEFIYWPN